MSQITSPRVAIRLGMINWTLDGRRLMLLDSFLLLKSFSGTKEITEKLISVSQCFCQVSNKGYLPSTN